MYVCMAVVSALLLMYVPVAVAGYYVYGTDVSTNIIQSLPSGTLRVCIEALISVHLIMACIIVLNPLSQQLEERCSTPNSKTREPNSKTRGFNNKRDKGVYSRIDKGLNNESEREITRIYSKRQAD